jgi:hypothetical protein
MGVVTSDIIYTSEMKFGDYTEMNVWDIFKEQIGKKKFTETMEVIQNKMKNS